MTDEDSNRSIDKSSFAAATAGTQVAMLAQYVKDLSFENPNAPSSLQEMADKKPEISVNVQVNARSLGTEGYEVSLNISAVAKVEKKTAFLVELDYAGIFGVRPIDDQQLEKLLLVECPRIMFPFARRILSDATRDGGFPPLLLDPMDFGQLYQQQKSTLPAGERPN